MEDRIEGVEKVSSKGTSATPQAVSELQQEMTARERFDNAMASQSKMPAPAEQVVSQNPNQQQPSLLDHVRDSNTVQDTKLTPENLAVQTDELISKMGQLKETLQQNPNLPLKPTTEVLMSNKLEHIDTNLKVALSKSGVELGEVTPTEPISAERVNPVDRFLGFLTDGQYQLETLASELRIVNNKELTPGAMLTIQVKVAQIQQEIELFTNLLNKSLESIKTIMNVQV